MRVRARAGLGLRALDLRRRHRVGRQRDAGEPAIAPSQARPAPMQARRDRPADLARKSDSIDILNSGSGCKQWI